MRKFPDWRTPIEVRHQGAITATASEPAAVESVNSGADENSFIRLIGGGCISTDVIFLHAVMHVIQTGVADGQNSFTFFGQGGGLRFQTRSSKFRLNATENQVFGVAVQGLSFKFRAELAGVIGDDTRCRCWQSSVIPLRLRILSQTAFSAPNHPQSFSAFSSTHRHSKYRRTDATECSIMRQP